MSFFPTLKAFFGAPTEDFSKYDPDQPCRFLLDNSTSATLTLRDGRKLGYAQYGLPTGKAILYNHGFPGSRLEASQHHEICAELGLRIISIDRPGYGWSSPHPGAKLLDWPKDLECLAEYLELESYAVMGVSGGGASALACAYALPPQKLKCVSMVCAMGPPDIGMRGADISHQFGWPHGIPRLPYRFGRWFWRSQAMGRLDLPEAQRVHLLMQETQNVPERDRDIFQDVDFLRLVIRSIGQAFAQGYDYVWDDGVMSCSEFGFRVEEIRKDLVMQLWYGREDWSVPVNHGVQIAKRIGDKAQLRVEDETHSGIVVHWKREIFEAIAKSI